MPKPKLRRGAAPPVANLVTIDRLPALASAYFDAVQNARPTGYASAWTTRNPRELDTATENALDEGTGAVAATVYGGFNNAQLYTWLGSNAMVAVGPPGLSTLYAELTSEETKDRWYKQYKNLKPEPLPSAIAAAQAAGKPVPESSSAKAGLTPHAFALANSAYFFMRRSGVDQSIVLRGESGSSKTLQTSLILQQLCAVSGASKRDERMHRRVQAAHSVLTGFGSAKLTTTQDASRVGSYWEIQFSERGKMVGAKVLTYALDTSRILTQRLSERNFHVFYYLLAGASPELRTELSLDPNGVYAYLNYGALPTRGLDDAGRFNDLQEQLRQVGLSKRVQVAMWRVLAAILHIGNLKFEVDRHNEEGTCLVTNRDVLLTIANLLEVDIQFLESALTTSTTVVGRDLTTALLSTDGAAKRRDGLAKVLYSVLFTWIVESINKKLCCDEDMANFIAIIDFPGTTGAGDTKDDATTAAHKYANERIDTFLAKRLFEYGNQELRAEGMNIKDTKLPVSTSATDAFSARKDGQDDLLPGDFVHLFRGGNGHVGSRMALFQDLFSESVINLEAYEKNAATVVRAQSVMKRQPSMKRRSTTTSRTGGNPGNTDSGKPEFSTVTYLKKQMDGLVEALENTNVKVLFALRHNKDPATTAFDLTLVRDQARALHIMELLAHVHRRGGDYSVRYSFEAFAAKYADMFDVPDGFSARDRCLHVKDIKAMTDEEMFVGKSLVILRDDAWVHLETLLRKHEQDAKKRSKRGTAAGKKFGALGDGRTEYSFDGDSVYSDGDMTEDGGATEFDADSVFNGRSGGSHGSGGSDRASVALTNMERNKRINDEISRANPLLEEPVPQDAQIEEYSMTPARRRWIFATWFLTWWVPTPFLRWCGGMKRDDVRMAWREKLAIFILIMFMCAIQLFFIIGFGRLICPRQNILNLEELSYRKSLDEPLVAIYGGVYNLNKFNSTTMAHSSDTLNDFAGLDITAGFPRSPVYYCEFAHNFSNAKPLFTQSTHANGTILQLFHRPMYQRNMYGAQLVIDAALRSRLSATVGWDPNDVASLSASAANARFMVIIKNRVYDVQPYIDSPSDQQFLPGEVLGWLKEFRGARAPSDSDFMKAWEINPALRNCFNNLFVVGVVDYRKSGRCMFTNYILVAFSVLLALVIGAKFLAALQLGSVGAPEEHDKFVILQVPCYTEGEESMRKTIDSLAVMSYDDKRKLLVVLCDGNIMGSGNDRPTPRIALDILGVDPSIDPEPLSFQSLGEGMKQHNMAKVYSGLYECAGHLVPFVVIVKVGKPSERSRPGNRGKRDSQMILMRFLNKVYFDAPMSPLELEIYHNIQNVIGVNPSFYELLLTVDSDTTVSQDSLNRLVSVMTHDTKVIGCCGETRLANEKDTWATMIQVYEYFISHHMAKAFESLFGSVTCLPGCFSMYRLRSPSKGTPLLASNNIIEEYGDCNVDTLHKKNLLHLGEDRYLTTLLLKHFPSHRTVFTADAKCQTIAPDRWDVLLSQRRRWINSTIHNLFELLSISQLCGFCCFSMRFVVFIDLIATFTQPAVVAYLGYLIYMIVDSTMRHDMNNFPMISLVLLGTIYGLQALIFLIKREWQHVGWMIIYILAIPVFSFFIPVYSFWKMDDFSWGNTRVVIGEKGKKQVMVTGEEAQKFDLKLIPHKRWSDYEAELLEAEGNLSPTPATPTSPAKGWAARDSVLGMAAPAYGDDGMSDVHSERSGYSARRSMAPTVDLKRSTSRGTDFSVGQYYGAAGASGMAPPVPQLPANLNPSPRASMGGPSAAGLPTDEEIYYETRRILSTANLMTITKKQVRDELSALFNVDMTPRREFINQCINEFLASAAM
ncbi:hypothetical protein GGF31_006829 [Allomyces arbusculus]|nr:hypothetical protein GGF31_006829 [Allomyces arbusculus]